MGPQPKICPQCQGEMWDNRAKKAAGTFSPKGPDFSCKNKEGCGKVIWPSRENTPPRPVSTYPGNPSFTQDVKYTKEDLAREKISIPDPQTVIARESAGRALGQLFSGKEISLLGFITAADILSKFYMSGEIPLGASEVKKEEVFTEEDEKALPF